MTIIERLQLRGIRRLGSPRSGFRYRHAQGRAVAASQVERIQSLRIPPAWRDVAIHPSPRAKVQAIGRDAAGRWQYLYHASHVTRREREKQKRLIRFIAALPRARRTIARHLASPGLPREKVLAGILSLLSTCFLRPGSEDYADENGTYGIATLRRQHVEVSGDRVRFDFIGKAGKRQRQEIRDRRIARLMRELLRYPGEVFKFKSEDGRICDVRRKHINAYIKEVMGASFSAKDFRTWAANLLCASTLARRLPMCDGRKSDRKRHVAAALREVAEHLGNTPAVCRASYVFDSVLSSWEKGRVVKRYVASVDELAAGPRSRLERCERALLDLLGRAA